MRSMRTLAAALTLFGLASPAAAVPTAFSGTLSVLISMPDGSLPSGSGVYAPFPLIEISATGTADVTYSGGNLTAFSLAGGTFATTETVPVTDPRDGPITQLVAQNLLNGAGSFTVIPGGNINNDFGTNLSGTGSGVMGVSGLVKLGILPGPLANVTVPFTSGGVNGVGLGGNIVIYTGAFGVSVRGAPWTTGTASIGTATAMGFVAGNTIQLVSPTFISTTLSSLNPMPSFATLTLSFVPEPGTLLLVASGVAGLALLGRRATRR